MDWVIAVRSEEIMYTYCSQGWRDAKTNHILHCAIAKQLWIIYNWLQRIDDVEVESISALNVEMQQEIAWMRCIKVHMK